MDDLARRLARDFGGANPKNALSESEIAEGLSGCYVNATALLDDARLLAEGKRLARAGALVVLALEELAKIPALYAYAVAASTAPGGNLWKSFWKSFQSHAAKQEHIAQYGKWVTAVRGGATPLANPGPYAAFLPDDLGRLLDLFKQRSLYVDYWDGRFVIPGSIPQDLPLLVDFLYAVALERADSFAAMHGSKVRSDRMVAHGISAARNASHTRLEELAKVARPIAVETDDDLRAELHSLIASRSSALVPDHASAYGFAVEHLSAVPDARFSAALQAEAQVLAERIKTSSLPTSAARAYAMFRLLLGLADQRGIKLENADDTAR